MFDYIDVSNIDDTNYINKKGNKLKGLTNVKKINIFIGENNSGKSRLLRNLIKNNFIYILSNDFVSDTEVRHYNQTVRSLKNNVGSFNYYSERKIELPDDLSGKSFIEQYKLVTECLEELSFDRDSLGSTARSYYDGVLDNVRELYNYLSRPAGSSSPKAMNKCDITYIPVLRGIENFNQYYSLTKNKDLDTISMNESQRLALEEYKNNAKHLYLNKVKKAYEFTNDKVIFTAEDLYDEITAKLLGEESGRKFIKEFQNFISEEFYDGNEFTIIPQQKHGYLNVKIGDEEDRALHNLGGWNKATYYNSL